MLIEDVGEDSERWAAVIGRIAELPDEARRKAIAGISRIAATGPDETFKSRMWPLLRDLVVVTAATVKPIGRYRKPI